MYGLQILHTDFLQKHLPIIEITKITIIRSLLIIVLLNIICPSLLLNKNF